MFKNGEKFGVLTWDWKAHGPTKSERESMKSKGYLIREEVPEELIFQDCYAAIYSQRELTDEEVQFAWEQYDDQYDNPNSYIEEIDNNIYQVYNTTWEKRNKE